jgi:type I restriction enzyme, S subunit
MKNYKRIGDFIQLVNERNSAMSVNNLQGINIDKFFMPSVANIVGTDLSVYKLVKQNQFACNRMHVGRDYRIPISLSKSKENFIVSPAYDVFEILDSEILDPEYLMMWFSRKEFDRNAWFYTDADVRGGLPWKSFCDIKLPVPPIAQQRETVAEYNTIQNRINLNQQLIQKLEKTAQAIYRDWFVDGIDKENLPEGWSEKSLTEVIKLSGGGTPDTNNNSFWNGEIPFFTPADVSAGYYSIQTEKTISESGLRNSSTRLYPQNTVFVTARGTVGAISIAGCEMSMNQSCYAITGEFQFFIHQLTIETMNKLKTEAVGAVFGALVTKDFDAQLVIEPPKKAQKEFDNMVSKFYDNILLKTKENQKLTEMKELLLAKMARNKDQI